MDGESIDGPDGPRVVLGPDELGLAWQTSITIDAAACASARNWSLRPQWPMGGGRWVWAGIASTKCRPMRSRLCRAFPRLLREQRSRVRTAMVLALRSGDCESASAVRTIRPMRRWWSMGAPRLLVSRPALGRDIRSLELYLGGALFDRNQQSVRVSRRLGALLRRARVLCAEAARARAVAREPVESAEGSRRPGGGPTCTGTSCRARSPNVPEEPPPHSKS